MTDRISRREFIRLSALALAGIAASACNKKDEDTSDAPEREHVTIIREVDPNNPYKPLKRQMRESCEDVGGEMVDFWTLRHDGVTYRYGDCEISDKEGGGNNNQNQGGNKGNGNGSGKR